MCQKSTINSYHIKCIIQDPTRIYAHICAFYLCIMELLTIVRVVYGIVVLRTMISLFRNKLEGNKYVHYIICHFPADFFKYL